MDFLATQRLHDVPELECECKNSNGATISSGKGQEFAANVIESSACKEGGKVQWKVSLRGLVAGFVYNVYSTRAI